VIDVFVDVVFPVLLIAAVGGWVARLAGMPMAPLAALTFNLFSPALVFDSLRDISASGATVGRIVLVSVVGFVVAASLSMAWSRAVGHDRPTLAASALCAAVANMGNMGLPIATLAFGRAGLDVAVVAFVASSLLSYSGGIVIASLASGSMGTALRAPLRAPAMWAAVAAMVVRFGDVPMPEALEASTSTLAGAAIPCMLVVLGLQVGAGARAARELGVVAAPLVLRLCLSPGLMALSAAVIGLDGVARRTMIVLAGMPTAVNATIIAARYAARPDMVTQVVVMSTLLSVITLPALISVLR
jgi:predicted permease